MENFNVLVSGGDQEEDLIADGWTDIFRNLTGIAAKQVSKKLGRRLTSKEKGHLMKMADYQKMNSVRQRVDDIVEDQRPQRRSSHGTDSFANAPVSMMSIYQPSIATMFISSIRKGCRTHY